MSDAKIYNQYAYIAGVKTPILATVISSNFGSLASLNVTINYSPFITRLHKFTKIQIWEQIIEGELPNEPTLEFDGIIVGIQRRKNLLGEVNASLSCLTDGAIWNIRKQADFYLQDIINADYRGTGDVLNMRADGQIFNFFADVLSQNRFDIGCCVASILTSYVHGRDIETDKTKKSDTQVSYYRYSFNGKLYEKKILENGNIKDGSVNPYYYNKFLDTYKLDSKLYGISTSNSIKAYFKENTFLELLKNTQNDVYGENTFWQLALSVCQYGFFNVYDIPNPTFINTDSNKKNINVDNMISNDIKEGDPTPARQDDVTLLKNKSYKGLAEYIFKPVSVMGIPFKCNVIWPDQVLEESIFYDFFNTPTRILYKRSPIPGLNENQETVLTTTMIVGPNFNSDGYLKSLTPKVDEGNLRDSNVYSDYEKEYGVNYTRLRLKQAFDSALLKDVTDSSLKNQDTQLAFGRVKNYLNYEFAQKFLSARQYSIMVTPDCNPVPGFPLVVLNKNGEHIIAFCTGTRKAWAAGGQKNISLTVAYPRYYFEDFGDLGNVIDTVSQDQVSLDEISMLIGSKPLDGVNAAFKNHTIVRGMIIKLFREYQTSDSYAKTLLKLDAKRNVCSYKQFMEFHGSVIFNEDNRDMPATYLLNKFDSTKEGNQLSCNYFEVYDTIKDEVVSYSNLACSEIINKHLEWIQTPKRI